MTSRLQLLQHRLPRAMAMHYVNLGIIRTDVGNVRLQHQPLLALIHGTAAGLAIVP